MQSKKSFKVNSWLTDPQRIHPAGKPYRFVERGRGILENSSFMKHKSTGKKPHLFMYLENGHPLRFNDSGCLQKIKIIYTAIKTITPTPLATVISQMSHSMGSIPLQVLQAHPLAISGLQALRKTVQIGGSLISMGLMLQREEATTIRDGTTSCQQDWHYVRVKCLWSAPWLFANKMPKPELTFSKSTNKVIKMG